MRNVFGEEIRKPRRTGGSGGTRKPQGLGCEHCLMNEADGIQKIIGIDRIKGRRAMVWAQSPGAKENDRGLELVGAVGKFLWEELKTFGVDRSDVDVQNVIRCRPWNEDSGGEYESTSAAFKKILKCCSVYNHPALEANHGKAAVHLILGKVAGGQLLGKAYNKKKGVFWHEPWNAYVVIADHPSYLLRLGGRSAGFPYYTFRDRLKAFKTILDHPGRYGYLKAQDYGAVTTPAEMAELKEWLYYRASLGERIVVDVEDGKVDGKKIPLIIGYGWGATENKVWEGGARSVVLCHPEADQSPARIKPLLRMNQEIIEDPKVKKTFQHGSYDDEEFFMEVFGWHLRGYDYDTQYGTYLRMPNLRSYSLANQCNMFLPEFGDYKDMAKAWGGNFAAAPLADLVLYNCADCDSMKRLEEKFADQISLPLLHVYIHCAYILERMEKHGPFLDTEALAKVVPFVRERVTTLKRHLEQIAGGEKEGFNPNTPAHIAWLVFDKLGLPTVEGRSTSKDVMNTLLVQHKSKVPQTVNDYRGMAKLESTYLIGYAKSAELHSGRVTTIWHLTGAATGRLRSGKGDKAETEEGIVNLQNIHGNPILKNLLVSDPNWRRAL